MNRAKVQAFMKKEAPKYRNSFGELDIVDLVWLAIDEFGLDFDVYEEDLLEIAMDLE